MLVEGQYARIVMTDTAIRGERTMARNRIARIEWRANLGGYNLSAVVHYRGQVLHSERTVSDASGAVASQSQGQANRLAESWALANGFTGVKHI